MTSGIGIDSVEISRFNSWHTFSHTQLKRLFSETEIAYCLKSSSLSAERFAARFATKEAFFKAFCAAFPQEYRPFLTVCKAVSVENGTNNVPHVQVDWKLLSLKPSCTPLISLTHTHATATAIIFLQKLPT